MIDLNNKPDLNTNFRLDSWDCKEVTLDLWNSKYGMPEKMAR